MTTNTQDALASAAEVAIFGWSLLELLLTRILPLVGFLAGHLLLQFGSLLSSVVITPTTRRPRRPRASEFIYPWDDQLQVVEYGDNVHVVNEEEHTLGHVPQAEELAQEAVEEVPVVKEKHDEHHQNNPESLKSSDEEQGEISRGMAEGKPSVSLATLEGQGEKADPAATAEETALPLKPGAPSKEQVTASNDVANEKPAHGSSDEDAAQASTSEAQNTDQDPSDMRERHVIEADTPLNVDAEGVKEGLVVSSKAEASAGGQIESKPSSTQTSEQTGSTARSGGKTRQQKVGGEGVETLQKSSSKRGSSSILRVLPPSLSQMERTLRQRSRRVTFSHAQH